jgi:hypothetical protein
MLDPVHARDRPDGWPPDPVMEGVVNPLTPGRVKARLHAVAGRYRVWIRGSSGRPISARVDGREVGELKHVNGPGQWIDVGEVSVPSGRHQLELDRPGGWISPGNGYPGEIGPLALQPIRPERLVTLRPADAGELCGKPWDWVELVDGRA